MNLFERYGLSSEDQRILVPWLEASLAGRGVGPVSVDELAAYAAAAFAMGRRGGPGPAPAPAPTLPPPPSVAPSSPLVMEIPQVPPGAPVPLLPQGVHFGRAPRGMGPGPVPMAGPTPAHVQIGSGGARVQIHDPNAGAPPSSYDPNQAYTGQLQAGQTRVEIALPDGQVLPPIFKDSNGHVQGATPAPLLPQGGPAVPSAAAPGTLAGAMESVKLAGQIGAPQIAALDAVDKGDDPPAGQVAILMALGLLELKEGVLAVTQNGREARQIARNRLEAHAPPG